jgi:hypothetical protein
MPINYTVQYQVVSPVDTINTKYKINSASTYTILSSISGASFPYFASDTLTVPDGNDHVVYNFVVESICDGIVQFGEIRYLYNAIPSPFTATLGTFGGDPAIDVDFTALCNSSGDSVKEYICTFHEQGNPAPPIEIVIPSATVIAAPGFPNYSFQITSVDGIVAGTTYDVTFQTKLRFKYNVDVSVDPAGFIIVDQLTIPISTAVVST